jgi:hypothetical protein
MLWCVRVSICWRMNSYVWSNLSRILLSYFSCWHVSTYPRSPLPMLWSHTHSHSHMFRYRLAYVEITARICWDNDYLNYLKSSWHTIILSHCSLPSLWSHTCPANDYFTSWWHVNKFSHRSSPTLWSHTWRYRMTQTLKGKCFPRVCGCSVLPRARLGCMTWWTGRLHVCVCVCVCGQDMCECVCVCVCVCVCIYIYIYIYISKICSCVFRFCLCNARLGVDRPNQNLRTYMNTYVCMNKNRDTGTHHCRCFDTSEPFVCECIHMRVHEQQPWAWHGLAFAAGVGTRHNHFYSNAWMHTHARAWTTIMSVTRGSIHRKCWDTSEHTHAHAMHQYMNNSHDYDTHMHACIAGVGTSPSRRVPPLSKFPQSCSTVRIYARPERMKALICQMVSMRTKLTGRSLYSGNMHVCVVGVHIWV